MNPDDLTYPKGTTSARWWRRGYRAAMADIRIIIEAGGTADDIATWVRDNG